MHKMNANRVSDNGTSTAISNEAMSRIASVMDKKVSPKTAIKKTAAKKNTPPVKDIVEPTPQFRVASLDTIPADFECMGTGFYRRGHHLWELSPSEGGFILKRKHNEDHVIGYDPEPFTKNSDISDRSGHTIKIGSRVTLPHRGQAALGTVVIVRPGSIGVDLDSHGKVEVAPDMCEVNEFEPDVESTSKKAQAPSVAPTAPVKPQVKPAPAPVVTQPMPKRETEKFRTDRKVTAPAGFEQLQKDSKLFKDVMGNQGRLYVASETGYPWYEIEFADFVEGVPVFRVQALSLKPEGSEQEMKWEDFRKFEQSLGSYKAIGGPTTKLSSKLIATILDGILPNMKTWDDYWYDVGQRVAANKPLTPEQREKRKQRRKERKLERTGLPPGAKIPPKSKTAADANDQVAELKEKVRLYQQLLDEIEYVLQDESLRDNEQELITQLDETLQRHYEEQEDLDHQEEMEAEDKLSIETKPENKFNMDMPVETMSMEEI